MEYPRQKNAPCAVVQKPSARMSTQASSSVLVVLSWKASPSSDWRPGSMQVLGQTFFSRLAVRSRILLCRSVGKPPLWQLMAWSTERESPQAHWRGRNCNFHPYLRHNASLKAPLCKRKPCSSMGRVVTHEEVPFSPVHSSRRWCAGGS